MDKRLIGQWYKTELGETVDIFDESPLRMKMSFSSSGHYHFEPNCVYEQDGWFCYEINDEVNRMVYRVRYEDGRLVGRYTRFGGEVPVVYERVSDTPCDDTYCFEPVEMYVPGTKETRHAVLLRHATYLGTRADVPYSDEFVLGGEVPDTIRALGFEDYIRSILPTDDRLAFRVMDFVCDHFGHNGYGGLSSGRRMADIVAFCDAHEGRTNCRGLAILLASLLRVCGLRARHITCMPYEDPFEDCHVVVDCELPSGARVMLDPTQRLYYRDTAGNYVSLPRLRRMLIAGDTLLPNPAASYNGGGFAAEENEAYMTKNTFRFSRGTYHADGADEGARRRVQLVPAGYDTAAFPQQVQETFVFSEEEFWKI